MLTDFFADVAMWQVVASGQAEGRLSEVTGAENGGEGAGLRLEYDFHGGGGFVVVRRVVDFALPEAFELGIFLRGKGLGNHLEVKLVDPSGANAWRCLRENYELPVEWEELRITERDLPFVWGPAGGGALGAVGAVELVMAAGPGGSGVVEFSGFSLVDESLQTPHEVSASSSRGVSRPESVFEMSSPSGWQASEEDAAPWWQVDFGRMVRFGGVVVDWPVLLPVRKFAMLMSADGVAWERIYEGRGTMGARSHISTPRAEARFLRLEFADAECAALVTLGLRPDAFSHTPNEFIHAVAADFPRGWFPRYWYREQSYWTPVGSPAGRRRGLLNEEGMVEVDEAGFSLEPFLRVGGKLVTWADAETRVLLPPDGAPFPEVEWTVGEVKLRVRPWVDGAEDALALRVNYEVTGAASGGVELVVAVRPYQVNPPWQAFRNLGGRSEVRRVVCGETGLMVDGKWVGIDDAGETLISVGAAAFEEGGVVGFLAVGEMPERREVEDASGLASAAMLWTVPKSGGLAVTLTVPFFAKAEELTAASRENALARWREILAPVEWQVPELAAGAVACFRTAAAHILINRDGPAIQPGPRRYTRSWVRDCVIMGAALAKCGQPQALREFLVWYAPFQREDGFVPAVVDRDGVDWIVEHDSHGQLLWGIREVFRDGGDVGFLKSMWLTVRKAAEFLHQLRAQRMTREYDQPERAACFGLLPESASHEGYLAHPVHSYWDDFWGIRGLEAAGEIAGILGHSEDSVRWHSEAKGFLGDVTRSMECVIAARGICYLPGSVEWADFDPTATANAIAQLDFADDLPAGPLREMLATYLDGFRKKHRGEVPWVNYTAYEIRIIGAFVRLGKREEAHELLDFFLSDRRPLEWNQWPEITWRDPRSPGHLGDVPHTWIAAEFIIALAAMVASEREESGQLVMASGLPWAWISEENGFSVRGLMTRYGPLDFRMSGRATEVTFCLGALRALPPGGIVISPPLPPGMRILSATDSHGDFLKMDDDAGSVFLQSLPTSATLILEKNPPTTLA